MQGRKRHLNNKQSSRRQVILIRSLLCTYVWAIYRSKVDGHRTVAASQLREFKGRQTGQSGVSLWKHGPAVALCGCWLWIGRVGVGGWGATMSGQWCGFKAGGFLCGVMISRTLRGKESGATASDKRGHYH